MTAEFYALKGMFLAQINKYVCYIRGGYGTLSHLFATCLVSENMKPV